jgi:hypothetical protein
MQPVRELFFLWEAKTGKLQLGLWGLCGTSGLTAGVATPFLFILIF